MKYLLPLLTALLLMAGCSTSPHKDNDCLPEIKVNQTPDKKEITFQEIAENISYFPLETNDSMLLRGVFLSICNEGIAVMTKWTDKFSYSMVKEKPEEAFHGKVEVPKNMSGCNRP